MIILFRVDTGTMIGTGHLLRCLSLADYFTTAYHNCQIIWATVMHSNNLISRIPSHHQIIRLNPQSDHNMTESTSTWLGNIDQDVDGIVDGLHSLMVSYVDLLVVDHYAIDYQWESWFLGKFPDVDKIMVIDDLANRDHICDYLVDTSYRVGETTIDHNDIRYDDEYYNNRYHNNQLISRDTKVLLGGKYFMLNDQFTRVRYLLEKEYTKLQDRSNNPIFIINVAFGGADVPNVTSKVVQLLLNEYRSHDQVRVEIILGGLNQHKDDIQNLVKDVPNFSLYQNISYDKLSGLLANTHLSICAGGVSLYERCAMAIPSIVITIADNQIESTTNMAKDGIITYIGGVNNWNPDTNDLITSVNNYLNDKKYWQSARERCMKVVDEHGCQRIAEHLDLNEE